MTIQNIKELLNCANDKAVKIKKELINFSENLKKSPKHRKARFFGVLTMISKKCVFLLTPIKSLLTPIIHFTDPHNALY